MPKQPEGWSYDNGEWTHEDCTALAGPGRGDLVGCSVGTIKITNPISYLIKCHDCGAKVSTSD